MFERACSGLDPLKCQVGWPESPDAFHIHLVSHRPVLAPQNFGTPMGTVESPRAVESHWERDTGPKRGDGPALV